MTKKVKCISFWVRFLLLRKKVLLYLSLNFVEHHLIAEFKCNETARTKTKNNAKEYEIWESPKEHTKYFKTGHEVTLFDKLFGPIFLVGSRPNFDVKNKAFMTKKRMLNNFEFLRKEKKCKALNFKHPVI